MSIVSVPAFVPAVRKVPPIVRLSVDDALLNKRWVPPVTLKPLLSGPALATVTRVSLLSSPVVANDNVWVGRFGRS